MTNRVITEPTKLTPSTREQFCTLLMTNGGIVSRACAALNISRQQAYAHRHSDPDFAEAWDAAIDAGVEVLIDAAKERAMEISDTLMIFMLKNIRPNQFRDRRENQNTNTNQFIGKDGQPVDAVAVINLSMGNEGE